MTWPWEELSTVCKISEINIKTVDPARMRQTSNCWFRFFPVFSILSIRLPPTSDDPKFCWWRAYNSRARLQQTSVAMFHPGWNCFRNHRARSSWMILACTELATMGSSSTVKLRPVSRKSIFEPVTHKIIIMLSLNLFHLAKLAWKNTIQMRHTMCAVVV